MKKLLTAIVLATAFIAGCDSNVTSTPAVDTGHHADTSASDASDAAAQHDADQHDADQHDADQHDAALAPPWDPSTPLGGDRPATVMLPDDYTTAHRWPLIVLLHGYGASATIQNAYFHLSQRRTDRGFILVLPNGTVDASGKRFWNATDACCNFNGSSVDDVTYLTDLVAEAKQRLAVDPDRVYFMGHSNGGFMSYRMACELGSKIAAIASLAGAAFNDPQNCADDGKVSVLEIHGDSDQTVAYDGGTFFGHDYPGAQQSTQRWATRDGCDAQPHDGQPIDLVSNLSGAETDVTQWTGCDAGTDVALWTMHGAGHIPNINPDFIDHVLDFLLAHKR